MKDILSYLKIFYQATYLPICYCENNSPVLQLPETPGYPFMDYFLYLFAQPQKNIDFFITESNVYCGIVRNLPVGGSIFVGPVCTVNPNHSMLLKIMSEFTISTKHKEDIDNFFHITPTFSLKQFLYLISVLNAHINNELVDPYDSLMASSSYSSSAINQKLYSNLYEAKEANSFHNTFQFEQKMCHYIEEGNVERLENLLQNSYNVHSGIMSGTPLRHEKNQFIATITLVTRYSIYGGLDIETAYQLKSKKHGSLGGAVVGGMVAGPIGAVVAGSALGKTKTKTRGTTVSNQIPTCTHLGVLVNINGFVSEVVFISSQVDQSSIAFSRAQSDAQNLISQLGVLAKTPVPTSFLRPDEEVSVKAIDTQIANKQQELQAVIADKPVYVLPDMYRMKENKEMSDEEYIQYLASTDAQRMSEKEANEAAFKREQIEKKAAEKAKRNEEKEARHREKAQKIADANYGEKAKIAGGVIGKIIFWIVSVFYLLFAIVSFTTKGGILSGVLFCLTAICVNPLLTGYIRNIGKKVPVWILIIVSIIGFFAGVLTFPTA